MAWKRGARGTIQEGSDAGGYQDLTGFLDDEDGPEPKPQLAWHRLAPSLAACRPGKRSFHHAVHIEPAPSTRGPRDHTFLLVAGDCEPKHRGRELQPLVLRAPAARDDAAAPAGAAAGQASATSATSAGGSGEEASSSSGSPEQAERREEAGSFEWRVPRSELRDRLRGCSVVAVGGLVFVFGGLRLDSLSAAAHKGGSLGEGTYSTSQVAGDLRIFDFHSGKWRGIQIDLKRPSHAADADEPPGPSGGRQPNAESPGKRASIGGGGGDGGSPGRRATNFAGRSTVNDSLHVYGDAHEPEDEPYYTMQGEAPRARFEHASVQLEGRGTWLLVHGGRSAKHVWPIESSFVLQVKSKSLHWSRLHPGKIVATSQASQEHGQLLQSQARRKQFTRRGHTICSVPGQPGRLAMFGGRMDSGEGGRICSELMILEVDPYSATYMIQPNHTVGSPPCARIYHCCGVLGHFMAIFGGVGRNTNVLNDLYLLHVGPMIWSKIHIPSDPESPYWWPTPRWGHAAATLERPRGRGGAGLLVFGGLDEEGAALDDCLLLAFETPLGAGGEGAGAGAEALSVYPEGVVLSLWDRLFTNLSTLEHGHMQLVSKQAEETQQSAAHLDEMENTLVSKEADVANAEQAVAAGERAVQAATERLETTRAEVRHQKLAMAAQIRASEAKVELLRRKLQRLEVTKEILELGRLLPAEDVAVRQDDPGGIVAFKSDAAPPVAAVGVQPIDTLRRRAGSWCGTPVTIDEVRLPSATVEGEDNFRKSFGPKMVPQRQTWETAIQRELRLAGRLRHPNLVEYFGGTIDGDRLLLVSEPPLVPLLVELRARKSPRLEPGKGKGRLTVALDVALALEYLHCRGVVHRRVGLQRIFLRDAPRLMAKLGDLLPARLLSRGSRECALVAASRQAYLKGRVRNYQSQQGGPSVDHASSTGVPDAAALQQQQQRLQQQPDPRTADIFAFGVIVLQLFSTDSSVSGDDKSGGGLVGFAAQALSSTTVGKIKDRALRLVVMRCMEKDPSLRMSASVAARALEGAVRGDQFLGLEALPDDRSRSCPLVDADLEAAEIAERNRQTEEDGKKISAKTDSNENSTATVIAGN